MKNVLEKGYGKVSKLIIRDKEISIGAKGIYSLFCAYSNDEGVCFPQRATIMSYLQIGSRNTYYKYLNELISKKLIKVKKNKIDGRYASNSYTINREHKGVDIFSKGYGIIPRSLVNDKNLSIESKVVYTYLSCYSDKDKLSYALLKQIQDELLIKSGNSLNKHITFLVNNEYISKQQATTKGAFSSNLYKLMGYDDKPVINYKDVSETIKEDIKARDEKVKEQKEIDMFNQKLTERVEVLESRMKDSIKYSEVLKVGDEEKKKFYDDVIKMFLSIAMSKNKTVKINGNEIYTVLATNMLLRLDDSILDKTYEKIQEVLENGEIKNIKAYVLSILYNEVNDIRILTKNAI